MAWTTDWNCRYELVLHVKVGDSRPDVRRTRRHPFWLVGVLCCFCCGEYGFPLRSEALVDNACIAVVYGRKAGCCCSWEKVKRKSSCRAFVVDRRRRQQQQQTTARASFGRHTQKVLAQRSNLITSILELTPSPAAVTHPWQRSSPPLPSSMQEPMSHDSSFCSHSRLGPDANSPIRIASCGDGDDS